MVKTRPGIAAALVAIWLGGVAACSAATPSPLDADGSTRTPAPSAKPSGTPALPRSSASPAPSATPRLGLGAELEVLALGPGLTGGVLEFASDGASIIFSSDLAGDSAAQAAPDVWRYLPGPAATPELVWRNPQRDHSVVKLGGDHGMLAFVDIPLSGERAWDLRVVPEMGAEAIPLDSHPGDEAVSSLVPSFTVQQPIVAWTAFDAGPDGPVSQLLVAEAPDWQPQILLERPAAEAELWLPSLYGNLLAFTEVRYSEDRSTDERSVHLLDLAVPGAEPRRLDTSGRATMPLATPHAVLWKEADAGFNMFNWGKMFRYDLATGEVSTLSTWPQEYVNYPSVGSRFVAWWGADAFTFSVYDLVRDRARLIAKYSAESQANVLRPHVWGDLLVWMYVETPGLETYSELRWANLPNPKDP